MVKVGIEKIVVGQMQTNCYLFFSSETKETIIIDPGDESEKIKSQIKRLKLLPRLIIHTHGHIDHIKATKDFDLEVYIHRLDKAYLKNPLKNLSSFFDLPFILNGDIKLLEDKERVQLADIYLEVIHTPGHTPGGICLRYGDILFSGDTLFYHGVGRTDFSGASEDELISSIKRRLFSLKDSTLVYPGHGPATSIGEEKLNNPFLV